MIDYSKADLYKSVEQVKKEGADEETLKAYASEIDRRRTQKIPLILTGTSKEEVEARDKLLKLPKRVLWDRIVIDELGKRIAGNIKQREIVLAFMLGRLVKNQKPASFNLLLKCASSSGKDWIVKNVGDLFPEGVVEYAGRITPKTLNYIHDKRSEPWFSYNGKVLYLEEIGENALNDDVMKMWLSGKNKLAGVEKGRGFQKEVEGKPSIIATSMKAIPSEEILNRFAVIELDMSEEQIKAILKQRARVAKRGKEEDYSPEILNLMRCYEQYSVEIPYADKIVRHFPGKEVREGRLIDRFFDLIRAIACFGKKEVKKGWIVTTEEDYEIAKDIFENIPFGFPDFLLSDEQRKILEFLEGQKKPLAANEILEDMKIPISLRNFRPHLQRLADLGRIEAIPLWNEYHQNVAKYQIVKDKSVKAIKLPKFEDL